MKKIGFKTFPFYKYFIQSVSDVGFFIIFNILTYLSHLTNRLATIRCLTNE